MQSGRPHHRVANGGAPGTTGQRWIHDGCATATTRRKYRRMNPLRLVSAFLLMASFLSAKPLQVGDAAPNASAPTESGKQLNLADVYSKYDYTLVYFYPKADTPGCTKQGCSLRDAYEQLTEKGVAIIGVSMDPVEAQHEFRGKGGPDFSLNAGSATTGAGPPTAIVVAAIRVSRGQGEAG